jgi:hypothetical protein
MFVQLKALFIFTVLILLEPTHFAVDYLFMIFGGLE